MPILSLRYVKWTRLKASRIAGEWAKCKLLKSSWDNHFWILIYFVQWVQVPFLHPVVLWYTCSQKFAHTCYSLLHKHPWQSELWTWHGRAKSFQSWGPFLKNMYLTLCQFSKKNLIRYVLWKVSNFALIFYVIRTLHKKSRQSLRPSTGRIGWDFFSKIGIEWGTYFSKKVPNYVRYILEYAQFRLGYLKQNE